MTKSSWMSSLRQRFQDNGALPTKRYLSILAISSIPVLLVSFFTGGWSAFITINVALVLLGLLDLLALPKRNKLSCIREIDGELERGLEFYVSLYIENHSTRSFQFRLIDGLPASFTKSFPIYGEVDRQSSTRLKYTSNPQVRGDYTIEKIYIRYKSALGLMEKQLVFRMINHIKVVPNMEKVKGYLAEPQKALIHQGYKVKKYHTGTGEFAQVRNYVVGDDPRRINWSQTAKLAEVMTNVYEPEHGKQITLMIDCGRMMGVELAKDNRMEYSLEAALTVAAVALNQGDYVSVIAFSNEIKKYVPPGKGLSHLNTIVQAVYNLHSDPMESNYAKAFDFMENHQKRRSFIILFSDLEPFLFEETLAFYLKKIRKKHLFVLLGISDPMVDSWIRVDPSDVKAAITKSVAQGQVLRKRRELLRYRKAGIDLLDVAEEKLASEALSRYIEVINHGAL